jgi:hypothetical protein
VNDDVCCDELKKQTMVCLTSGREKNVRMSINIGKKEKKIVYLIIV